MNVVTNITLKRYSQMYSNLFENFVKLRCLLDFRFFTIPRIFNIVKCSILDTTFIMF